MPPPHSWLRLRLRLDVAWMFTAYACLDVYHHPMMTWPPPKIMISPFVPPPILLFLPHDLIHLDISPSLGYASSS